MMYLVPSGIAAVFNEQKEYDKFRPQIPLTQLRESPTSGQKCSLCYTPGDQRDIEVFSDIGWRLRGNRDPNQPFSRLVLPLSCANWGQERLRILGDHDEIYSALTVLSVGLKEAVGKSSQILCHVGYSAGQNYYHPHYHIVQPHVGDCNQISNTERWLLRNDYEGRLALDFGRHWRMVIGGLFSSTIWLSPRLPMLFSDYRQALAISLNALVLLAATKCRNHENTPPDYHFMIQIGPNGEIVFVYFRIILNQIGANDGAGLNMGTQCTTYFPNEKIAKILFR